MITQTKWRAIGTGTLAASGTMALYAMATDLLRDSVLHFAALFSPEAAEAVRGEPSAGFVLYWLVFTLFVLISLYLAVIDFRYIRLQYRLEKRQIFTNTLGNRDFRDRIRNLENRRN